MCVVGLKDKQCFNYLVNELEVLLVDLEMQGNQYAYGLYAGLRNQLGFYDAGAGKELLTPDQHELHLAIFHTYTNAVDTFPVLSKGEVIAITMELIALIEKLEPVPCEEDDRSPNYFDLYCEKRDENDKLKQRIAELEMKLREATSKNEQTLPVIQQTI